MNFSEADIARIDWQKGDGLVPAVAQHLTTGAVLMLGYMNLEALQQTLQRGRVVFYSRTRKRLWEKGEESGNILKLVDLRLDCDVDALLVTAIPSGPVCHTSLTRRARSRPCIAGSRCHRRQTGGSGGGAGSTLRAWLSTRIR